MRAGDYQSAPVTLQQARGHQNHGGRQDKNQKPAGEDSIHGASDSFAGGVSAASESKYFWIDPW